jgi:hypothetical protein
LEERKNERIENERFIKKIQNTERNRESQKWCQNCNENKKKTTKKGNEPTGLNIGTKEVRQ